MRCLGEMKNLCDLISEQRFEEIFVSLIYLDKQSKK